MSTEDRPSCPACGAELGSDAPEGLCAKCVIEVMMNFDDLTVGAFQDDGTAPSESQALGHIGDYEILDKVAAGGMGVVYRARQRGMDRLVALKLVAEGKLASHTDKERFLMEARAAGELDHPNIVPIYEVGEDDGQYFFSMRLVPGGSLADWLAESPLFSISAGERTESGSFRQHQTDVVKVLVKVARGVHHAHERGILHRDLKPANILIDQHGEPQITDFGLAKRVEEDSHLTASGQLLGSPAYMAPEQAEGKNDELTPSTDVYAMGVMLYQALSGDLPCNGDSPMALLQETLTKEPVPLRKRHARVDRDLETIAHACLEKIQSDRYPSAQEFVDDLERWLDGRPIHAKPAGPLRRAQKWLRRQPAVAALLAISLLATTIIVGLTWRQSQKDTARAEEAYPANLQQAANWIQEKKLREARQILEQQPEASREWVWHWLHKGTSIPMDTLSLGNDRAQGLAITGAPRSSDGAVWIQLLDGRIRAWTPGSELGPPLGSASATASGEGSIRFQGGGRFFLHPTSSGSGAALLLPGTQPRLGTLPQSLEPIPDSWLVAAPGDRPSGFLSTGGEAGDTLFTWSPPWRAGKARLQLDDELLAAAISSPSQNKDGADRRYVALAYRAELEIWRWAGETFTRDKVIRRSPSPSAVLAFSPGRRILVEGDATGAVRIRNRESLAVTGEIYPGAGAAITALQVVRSQGIDRITAADAAGQLYQWDLDAQPPALDSLQIARLVPPLGIAEDGSALAGLSASGIKVVTLGSETKGEDLPTPEIADSPLGLAILETDPPRIALISQEPNGTTRILRVSASGTHPWSASTLPSSPLVAGQHRIDGAHWCFQRPGGDYAVVDLRDGVQKEIPGRGLAENENVRIFGSGAALWCPMDDGRFEWQSSPPSGRPIRHQIELQHPSPVNLLSLSPDEKTIAAAHADGTLRLWQAESGRLLLELDNHPWQSLQFSPDGKVLVAAESSGNVHVWDARPTPQPLP